MPGQAKPRPGPPPWGHGVVALVLAVGDVPPGGDGGRHADPGERRIDGGLERPHQPGLQRVGVGLWAGGWGVRRGGV